MREKPIGQDGTQRRLSGLRLPQVAGGAKLHELLNYTSGDVGVHTLNLGEQVVQLSVPWVYVHCILVRGDSQGERNVQQIYWRKEEQMPCAYGQHTLA